MEHLAGRFTEVYAIQKHADLPNLLSRIEAIIAIEPPELAKYWAYRRDELIRTGGEFYQAMALAVYATERRIAFLRRFHIPMHDDPKFSFEEWRRRHELKLAEYRKRTRPDFMLDPSLLPKRLPQAPKKDEDE